MLIVIQETKRIEVLACLIAMLITPGCGMVHRPAVVVDKMVVIDGSTGKVVSHDDARDLSGGEAVQARARDWQSSLTNTCYHRERI